MSKSLRSDAKVMKSTLSLSCENFSIWEMPELPNVMNHLLVRVA